MIVCMGIIIMPIHTLTLLMKFSKIWILGGMMKKNIISAGIGLVLIVIISFVVFILYKYRSTPVKSIINHTEQKIYAIVDNISMQKSEEISDKNVYAIVDDINLQKLEDISDEEWIKRGEFSILKEPQERIDEYERIFEIHQDLEDMEWRLYDINKDGYNDLIWQEKEARISNGKRIVGIFSCVPEKSRCIIWDTDQMTTGYFLSNTNKLVYYYQNYGIYSYNRYDYITYDENWKQKIEYSLEIYNIYDGDQDLEWQKGFADQWREKYNKELKKGVIYKKCISLSSNENSLNEYVNLSRDEFLKEYYELTGIEFQISREFESN